MHKYRESRGNHKPDTVSPCALKEWDVDVVEQVQQVLERIAVKVPEMYMKWKIACFGCDFLSCFPMNEQGVGKELYGRFCRSVSRDI